MVKVQMAEIPTAVVRPAIVLPSWKESVTWNPFSANYHHP
jgi:hypothetical protein